jgi:multiple sugar transport system permease protein
MVAFAVTRFSWRFNFVALMIFTAGNLLPPQVIILPLYRLYLLLPVPKLLNIPIDGANLAIMSETGKLYDQYMGIILIHIVFQMGFCIFVLSNYMRTLSKELTEAALADGAPVWRIYWNVILPLCRPALAALATLEFTFIYNDFFWALVLMKSGDRRPAVTALSNLQGQFFTDTNLLAAGALLVAIPTIIVYAVLQRQFISGLTLGSTKG